MTMSGLSSRFPAERAGLFLGFSGELHRTDGFPGAMRLVRRPLAAADVDHLESRHAGQSDVQDDQAAGFRFGQEKSGLAVLGTVGCVAGAFEKRDDAARKRGIIFDKQDSSRGCLPFIHPLVRGFDFLTRRILKTASNRNPS